MQRVRIARLGGLAVVLLASVAAGAAEPRLDRVQLCTRADLVIIGEVTSDETLWTPGGGIERHAWVAVARTIRGPAQDTVQVTLPGGVLGASTHWVEDVPELHEASRYLLFLYRDAAGGLQVLGGEQGAVLIQPPDGGPGEPHLSALASVATCAVR